MASAASWSGGLGPSAGVQELTPTLCSKWALSPLLVNRQLLGWVVGEAS